MKRFVFSFLIFALCLGVTFSAMLYTNPAVADSVTSFDVTNVVRFLLDPTQSKTVGGTVTLRDEVVMEKSLQLTPSDLNTSTLDPSSEGVYASHDGTDTGDAGLYRSDPDNNQWVKVEDNSETIGY